MTKTTRSTVPNTADASTQERVESAVRARSRAWIASFNAGDVDACVAGYADDAIMEARPVGEFRGRAAIDGFWRPFIQSGAGELRYSDVVVSVLGEGRAVLSASWEMNVGAGIITEELWVEQPDGQWLLERDAFEIQRRT